MADIRASRRVGSYGRRLSIAWLALAVASCADLLDLPSNPRLAEPAPQPESTEPAREQATPNDRGSGPEPLLAGKGDADDIGDPASVDSGTAPGSDEPSEPAPDGTGAGPIEDPSDAGAPSPESPEPPEEPPAVCAPAETVGPNGRCFLVVEELLSWDDARLNCQARGDGWDLAAIRSQAVNDFVGGLSDEETWLGGSDAATEATWRWVSDGDAFWSGDGTTGSAVDGAFEAWNSDEPNGRGNSDCARTVPVVRTGEGLTWADLECFELRASLCEGPPL